MQCPLCKTELVNNGREEKFETLVEHVECCSNDKNWKPELREVFECPNGDCEMNHSGSFWDEFGDFFSGKIATPRTEYLRIKHGLETLCAIGGTISGVSEKLKELKKSGVLSVKESAKLLGAEPPIKCNLVEATDMFANRHSGKFKKWKKEK